MHESPPQWALNLQAVFGDQLKVVGTQVREFSDRLAKVEEERAVDRSNLSSRAERLVDFTGQIEEIKRGKGAIIPPPGYFVASASTPAANASPSAPASDDTDYSHLVLGGWSEDSARATVENDAWVLIKTMTEVTVDKVV